MNEVNRLFWLASLFEKKAMALNVLSDHQSDKFLNLLKLLTNISPNKENINSWALKNKSVIDYNPDVFSLKWKKSHNDLIETYLNPGKDGNELMYYVSLTSTLPSDIDVQKSFYLKSDGVIPDLFLFTGFDLSKRFKVTKEMAHEKWLIEALSKLFLFNIDNTFLENVQQFIIENKTKINEFRKHFTGNPSVTGQGQDGVVLVLNPSLILKLFKSHYAYKSALSAIERIHKNTPGAKTEAMIYDTGTLGKFCDNNVYYYLMEKMTPFDTLSLPEQIEDKLEVIFFYLKKRIAKLDLTNLKVLFEDTSKRDIFDYEFNSYVSGLEISLKNNHEDDYLDIQDFIKMKPESLPLKQSWLSSLIEEILMKFITDRLDLGMLNIGITGYGELRFFDPAYK